MLGTSEILLLVAIVVVITASVLPAVWAATDAARQPNASWNGTGHSKAAWVVGPPISALLCGVLGLYAAWFYFTRVRREILAKSEVGAEER